MDEPNKDSKKPEGEMKETAMPTKKRKPRVIWAAQNTAGRFNGLIYYHRWPAAQSGKPIKFIEEVKDAK